MSNATTFLGLDSVAWSALSALGTLAAAAIALGALVFIAIQIVQTNSGQLGGLAQRAIETLLRNRDALYHLQHRMKAGDTPSWEELRTLRKLMHEYAFLAESVKVVARLTPTRERGILVTGYLTDLAVVSDLAKYALKQGRKRVEVFSADINKMLESFIVAVNASDADRKELQDLVDGRDVDRLRDVMTALSTKSLMEKGRTASAAVEELAKQEGRTLDDALDAMAEYGGDKENAILAGAIVEEIGEAMTLMKPIPADIHRILQRKANPPIFFWKNTQNAHG